MAEEESYIGDIKKESYKKELKSCLVFITMFTFAIIPIIVVGSFILATGFLFVGKFIIWFADFIKLGV